MRELAETYWLYFLVGQYPQGPLGGLALTLALASLALLASLPLGILLGLARMSASRWLRLPVAGFVHTVRGLPLLMVIFWAYFSLPALTGHRSSQFGTMLGALIVFDSAYLAEIVRAGIRAVPRGQSDAAASLGLGPAVTLRCVVLPQALRHMLPSLVNQFVATIKETSLGYIIGLTELSFVATQINSQVFTRAPEVYLTLAGTYFALCFGLSRLAYFAEARWSGEARSGRPARRRAGRA